MHKPRLDSKNTGAASRNVPYKWTVLTKYKANELES
jgi:hypothetical protein